MRTATLIGRLAVVPLVLTLGLGGPAWAAGKPTRPTTNNPVILAFETGKEMECKDVAIEGDESRVPARFHACDVAYAVEYMVPCAYEDGSGSRLPCFWNAAKAGNRVGHSFYVRHGRAGKTCFRYILARDAVRWNECTR